MELREDAIAAASVAYVSALAGLPHTSGNLLYAMRKGIEGYVDAASRPAPAQRCQARQQGDEMQCGRCGLSWDVNDADRPDCSPTERRLTQRPADEFVVDGLAGQWNRPSA